MTVRRLREVLNALGPPVATTELAEMVWLAGHLPAQGQGEEPQPGLGVAAHTGASDDHSGQEQQESGTLAPESRHAIFTPRAAPEPGASAADLLVPVPPMLRHPLKLQRALRPLKRRLPSRQRRLLDEDATAAQVADRRQARPWVPVMVAARERWINLALVVDTGPSMSIWQPLADEIREMLIRLGAFRAVRTWSLADLHDAVGIRSATNGPAMAPATLIDPTGRQIVILISDCSGQHWWAGHCGPAVHMWAASGPTAILQPLPERLWHRTAVPIVPGRAALPRPGAPNTALKFTPHDGRTRPQLGTLPVPVVELSSPDWLSDWARLATASGDGARDTAVTYQSARVVQCEEPLSAERNLPLPERILRFHAAASPEAAELAAHAAVAVPSLPVMRLIQQKIIPRSGPSDLAEVLLSGLLQSVSGVPGLYDFIPGARAALLEMLPRPETLATAEVLLQLADEIQARAGTASQTFRAAMRVTEGIGRHALSDGERPFALVSDEALHMLSRTAIPLARSTPSQLASSLPAAYTQLWVGAARGDSAPEHAHARGDFASHVSVTTTIDGRQFTLALPPEIPASLSGLPEQARVSDGLGTEMQAVLDALDPVQTGRSPASHRGTTVVITGPHGSGKTRLAVQAARIAVARGWFPGGVLRTGMRGYDQAAPAGPEPALGSLLRAFTVPSELIPDNPADRARLYAAVLAAYAENGRQVLVIIDDVSIDQRCDELLPAGGITNAILTSRDRLDLPRAQIVHLHAPAGAAIADRASTALITSDDALAGALAATSRPLTTRGYVGEAPYFFLSYAHTPKMPDDHGDPDKWIAKFYTDLCRHVIQFASGRSAAVGFMDREMRADAQWPSRLDHALANCRVFVPLYSPRYFESEDCGKEWSAFNQRARNQAARHNTPVEAIVPALWVPVDPNQLPPVARSIQFSHHSLGARYSEEGFWGIMKVRRYRDDYEFAVMRLAQRIVQVAEQTMLDRGSPADYHSLTSAFETRASSEEQRRPETVRRGGRRINIMIAAPTTRDMPKNRRSLAYYGASEREWNPYHPESRVPLADFTVDLVSRLGYRPIVVPFGELLGLEDAGEVPAAPGLFLVDPWAAATDSQATRLRQYDERATRWTNVLMPWNRADEETMAAETILRTQVTGALSRMLDRTPPEYQQAANRAPTLRDFAEILPAMARIADNRFLRDARAYPPSGPVIPRPMLRGPYSDDSEGML